MNAFRELICGQRSRKGVSYPFGTSYLAFSNSIDRALVALGLTRKQLEEVPDVQSYIAETYPEKPAGQGGNGRDKIEWDAGAGIDGGG